MARALDENEQEIFTAIREAPNMALLNCKFEGEEAAVVVAISEGDEYEIYPVALLLTDALKDRLELDGAKVSPLQPE